LVAQGRMTAGEASGQVDEITNQGS
jgi:hypothetical protein